MTCRRNSLKNAETASFVASYPQGIAGSYDATAISLSAEVRNGTPPLFLQWDPRWGYGTYGTSTLGLSGCGPTSLSIVVLALTGNTEANPLQVAEFSYSKGWYFEGIGTDWSLVRQGANYYGLKFRDLPLGDYAIRGALDSGELIIASLGPGDFTDNGHFIVIRGYVDADTPEEAAQDIEDPDSTETASSEAATSGYLIIDPNSEVRTDTVWEEERLLSQINGLWSYRRA